ncbi:peptidoglycan/LPS O-acetylase OafA/YrhL [Hamadaea flava]|uniref:Acyltransferase n=1 Tax=Hamadaea flava TaxID=1742688 RepID=A0ABV8LU84_9ACTN|nr:peptidoglycan/LPS O-acetylase OafA/YrhL [Hamadaea flava]
MNRSGDEQAVDPQTKTTRPRSRYVDTLRAVAITRVFLHHTLWISWLAVLFPSMFVMFGLAGAMTAASLERKGPAPTVRSRLRRTLPPLWALAAVAIPLMLINGWQHDTTNPLRWQDLLYWVLPLANPPASSWGGAFTLALWYIRAYIWFVLLSPIFWWFFQRWPVKTLVAPLTGAVLLYSPLVPLPVNRVGDVMWSTASYGTAWMLGFARHTRLLDRIPVWVCAAAAGVLGVAGYFWGAGQGGFPFADPIAETLWGTGFVLLALRARPTLAWLDRFPRLARLVSAFNARAITIYVWQLPVLFLTGALLQYAGITPLTTEMKIASLLVGAPLTALAVLAVGWVEDIAARRRPALVPAVPSPRSAPAGQPAPAAASA